MCEEAFSNRVHTEHAVLDIGEGVGALIIYTGPELRGQEIEVSPRGNDLRRTHTAVLERKIGNSHGYAALFLALAAGDYTIWGNDTGPVDTVTIPSGQVAEVDWRTR